jgi:hypothetical protein
LKALGGTSDFASGSDRSAVAGIVHEALADPTLSIRLAGESLAGSYGLAAFAGEIGTNARTAPTAFERDAAQDALEQLHRHATPAAAVKPTSRAASPSR